MLKYVLSLLFLINSCISDAQTKMVVEQRSNGNAYYGGASTVLQSFSEVPVATQVTVLRFLKETIGSLSAKATFSHGQVIELFDNSPSSNTITVDQPGRTKYDLNFLLQDTSIGIKSYYLRVRVDEFNQIKSINWPRKNYNNPTAFKPLGQVLAFALAEASKNALSQEDYQVGFKYSEKHDKLCWVFEFKAEGGPKLSSFNTIMIDWRELAIIEKGMMFTLIK